MKKNGVRLTGYHRLLFNPIRIVWDCDYSIEAIDHQYFIEMMIHCLLLFSIILLAIKQFILMIQ